MITAHARGAPPTDLEYVHTWPQALARSMHCACGSHSKFEVEASCHGSQDLRDVLTLPGLLFAGFLPVALHMARPPSL